MVGGGAKLSLLYRGSTDGYGQKDIAEKVYNKGKTLVIIKSDKQKVFGGFTPIPW